MRVAPNVSEKWMNDRSLTTPGRLGRAPMQKLTVEYEVEITECIVELSAVHHGTLRPSRRRTAWTSALEQSCILIPPQAAHQNTTVEPMKIDPLQDEISSVNPRPGLIQAAKLRFKEVFTRDKHERQSRDAASRDTAAPALGIDEEVFVHLMETANEIVLRQPSGLVSLVAAILRPLQAEQMLSVAERPQHGARAAIDLGQLFSPDYFFSYFDQNDCLQLPAAGYRLDLARDIVLPTPWRRDRFASALISIGAGKQSGPWRQDANHGVTLVLPWRFGIVDGGNHSITAGILGHEGELAPTQVIDLTPLFDRVTCDGKRFTCRQSGRLLARVSNGRMAALFEIGRMISSRR